MPAGRISSNPVSRVVPEWFFDTKTATIDFELAEYGFRPREESLGERDSRSDDGLDHASNATSRDPKVVELECDNAGLLISDFNELHPNPRQTRHLARQAAENHSSLG